MSVRLSEHPAVTHYRHFRGQCLRDERMGYSHKKKGERGYVEGSAARAAVHACHFLEALFGKAVADSFARQLEKESSFTWRRFADAYNYDRPQAVTARGVSQWNDGALRRWFEGRSVAYEALGRGYNPGPAEYDRSLLVEMTLPLRVAAVVAFLSERAQPGSGPMALQLYQKGPYYWRQWLADVRGESRTFYSRRERLAEKIREADTHARAGARARANLRRVAQGGTR